MKNNMNDNKLDNNLDKSLDQYFDKARKVQTDFSVDDAAALIESSNQSAINNVKLNKGVKPMNIIISAAAIVAAGWLATTIDFNTEDAASSELNEKPATEKQITTSTQYDDYLGELASPETKAQQKATAKASSKDLATMAQLPTKKDEDPVNRQEFSAKADTEKYALATESKSDSKTEKLPDPKQKFENSLNVTGINPISLTREEFRSLGIKLAGDSSLSFETNTANINLLISHKSVYSQEWKIKNEPDSEEYLTPQLITADGKDIIYSISISNQVSDIIPNSKTFTLYGGVGSLAKTENEKSLKKDKITANPTFTLPDGITANTSQATVLSFSVQPIKSSTANSESSEGINNKSQTVHSGTSVKIPNSEDDEDISEVSILTKEESSPTDPSENINIGKISVFQKKYLEDNDGKSKPRMVKYTEIITEDEDTTISTELDRIMMKIKDYSKSKDENIRKELDSINQLAKFNIDMDIDRLETIDGEEIEESIDEFQFYVDEMTSNIEWTFVENLVDNISETMENAYDEAAETAKINKLIPFKTTMKGKDLIFWYAASQELIDRVPERIREKIKSEIKVLSEAEDFCDAYPGSDAHFDIWRSCGGLIENLTVYPNPATTVANAVIDLKEDSNVRFSLHSLDGNELYSLRETQPMAKGKHEVTLPLEKVSSGFYLLVASTAEGDTALQRLIVKQ